MGLLVKKKAKSAANTCVADLKPKQLQVQAVLCTFCFIFSNKDVTLVCSNGTVNSNSFLLSSIFPVDRKTMETTIHYRDPDMDMMDLETFLQHLQEHHSSFKISNNV